MTSKAVRVAAVGLIVVGLLGAAVFLRPEKPAVPLTPLELFTSGAFASISEATLDWTALPLKPTLTALLLREHEEHGTPVMLTELAAIFRRFGLLTAPRLANVEGSELKSDSLLPLGLVSGPVHRSFPPATITAVNLGCASCHAGVAYDAKGEPDTQTVWLGQANTSFNPARYARAVDESLESALRDSDHLLDETFRLFPDTPLAERLTMRFDTVPNLRRRLAARDATKAPNSVAKGGPGFINRLGSLKEQLGLVPAGAGAQDTALTALPNIVDLLLRRSLLCDGLYMAKEPPSPTPNLERTRIPAGHAAALGDLMTFFTVPTTGVAPQVAIQSRSDMQRMTGELLGSLKTQPFPGPIDDAKAGNGRQVYDERCANCHGTYQGDLHQQRLGNFPNRLSPLAEIGTDKTRALAADPALVAQLRAAGFGELMDLKVSGGYIAPILTGVWSKAPYLHNGSVPTLWHLMHPASRPKHFEVGGHRLDLALVGIAGVTTQSGDYRFPDLYLPWSASDLYDTTKPGRGNGGHDAMFNTLSEAAKDALLEYMKLL